MPYQEELDAPTETSIKTTSPDIDFDNGNFDYTPLPKSRFSIGNLMEWTFERMRPKSKIPAPKIRLPGKQEMYVDPNYRKGFAEKPDYKIPENAEIQNGLLVTKKSLAEKVRDQIKHPWLKSSSEITRGLAAIVLCIGAVMIYAEIPGHPGIVVGIVLISLAGNVIMAKW